MLSTLELDVPCSVEFFLEITGTGAYVGVMPRSSARPKDYLRKQGGACLRWNAKRGDGVRKFMVHVTESSAQLMAWPTTIVDGLVLDPAHASALPIDMAEYSLPEPLTSVGPLAVVAGLSHGTTLRIVHARRSWSPAMHHTIAVHGFRLTVLTLFLLRDDGSCIWSAMPRELMYEIVAYMWSTWNAAHETA